VAPAATRQLTGTISKTIAWPPPDVRQARTGRQERRPPAV